MHTLITGGSGFIGLELVRQLRDDGQAVTVLTRDPATATSRLPGGTGIAADLTSLNDVDAVINLAGENLGAGRWTPRRKQAFLESRIGTTRRINAWIARVSRRPAVLVSGSAIGYYGARGDETITEDSTSGDDFAAGLCRAWEAEARHAEALGVRVCIVRTGVVLGRPGAAGGGALAQMLPPFRLGAGGPMGSGRQWMSWVHLSDLVALIGWLVRTDELRGIFNGTAPAPVRNADFARALGRALRRPAWLPMPAFALRAIVGEMAEILLTGSRVLPRRALDAGFAFRYPALDAALASLVSQR